MNENTQKHTWKTFFVGWGDYAFLKSSAAKNKKKHRSHVEVDPLMVFGKFFCGAGVGGGNTVSRFYWVSDHRFKVRLVKRIQFYKSTWTQKYSVTVL